MKRRPVWQARPILQSMHTGSFHHIHTSMGKNMYFELLVTCEVRFHLK
jgi:hypothetical protein